MCGNRGYRLPHFRGFTFGFSFSEMTQIGSLPVERTEMSVLPTIRTELYQRVCCPVGGQRGPLRFPAP